MATDTEAKKNKLIKKKEDKKTENTVELTNSKRKKSLVNLINID